MAMQRTCAQIKANGETGAGEAEMAIKLYYLIIDAVSGKTSFFVFS